MFIKSSLVAFFITAALVQSKAIRPGIKYAKRFASPEPRHSHRVHYDIGYNLLGSPRLGDDFEIKIKSSKKGKDGLDGLFNSAYNAIDMGAAGIEAGLGTALNLEEAVVKAVKGNAKTNVKFEASIF